MRALIASKQTYWMNWPPAEGIVAVPRNPEIDDFELSARAGQIQMRNGGPGC